ncbi:CpsD/CapB family tyrosine-protein kinase [Chryseomicrobium sp. FSL W7-1435]|uniref:CpsD/CapB family tyrosine-protein kinase n=1 Tax=Chryseomicrobium sp. FSL W7-1435 TaxID=2921704 RepID=UPI00315B3E66
MAKKPKFIVEQSRQVVVERSPKSIISEQFRTARTNINFSVPAGDLKTLVFTSSVQAEGKSTVSANLAHLFAQEGKKVLFIDADMRKPTLHLTMHTENTNGLSNVLTKQSTWSETIHPSEGTPNLDFITSGPVPPNPAELLASKQFDDMVEDLTREYDLIIFDAPPLLSVTDSQILANKCDGTVLVILAGTTQKDSVKRAKELLDSSQAHILGVVLNKFKMEKDHYYYYQYYGATEK